MAGYFEASYAVAFRFRPHDTALAAVIGLAGKHLTLRVKAHRLANLVPPEFIEVVVSCFGRRFVGMPLLEDGAIRAKSPVEPYQLITKAKEESGQVLVRPDLRDFAVELGKEISISLTTLFLELQSVVADHAEALAAYNTALV